MACGSDGKDGANGADGMNGSDGPAGPLNPPPTLTSLSPTWGSGLTQVTIKGASFSTTPTDNIVTFNGHPAMVLSAAADTLLVEANVAVSEDTDAVVNVEVANQVSNGLSFELVPSGTSRELMSSVPSAPTGAVVVGGKLYFAAGNGVAKSAGLYVQDTAGVVTKLLGGERYLVDLGGGTDVPIYDSPVGVATDGTHVFYSTALGDVYRYNPPDGAVLKILAAPNNNSNVFPHAPSILVDGNYVLVLERHLNLVAIIDTTTEVVKTVTVGAGVVSIAGNTTNLFLVDNANDRVSKVTTPLATPATTAAFITNVANPTAAVVNGTNVQIACDTGLYQSTVATGGAATDANINARDATGLSLDAGYLYMAKPSAGKIYKAGAAGGPLVPVAAGTQLFVSGATRIGDTIYLAELGNAGGSVLEVKADGSSRMLAAGNPIDVVAGAAGTLIVSDCTAQTISSVDIATGAPTVLLDNGDGLTCPMGMFRDAGGVLYYTDSAGPSKIGTLTGTTVNPSFASLTNTSPYFVEGIGTSLYYASLAFASTPIDVVTSGGVDSSLSAAALNSSLMSLNATASGRLIATRVDSLGLVEEIDPTTGSVSRVGTTRLPDQDIAAGAIVSGGATELPDGTLTMQATFSLGPIADSRIIATAP